MKYIMLLFIAVVVGCDANVEQDDSKIKEQCAEWATSCRSCAPGVRDEYRYCYFDSRKYASPSVVREDCIAVHVGNKCQPCESIFAMNFGGALSDVTCENFFKAIEKRNKLCDGCVKSSTELD